MTVLTTSSLAAVYTRPDGGQCRVGWLFINGPPHPLLVRAPWECAAPRSGARCVLRTQWNTDLWTGPLCKVPIM
ncbi:unnamed protein product [Staurois parvus]|uniref:Uncharacterized protein n=1 Tax=Staurois parvus TaxID=386267 RepID=A0ABN9AN59_9NEOB|nr:unnamed protein product [Staurois parvus]